MLDLQSGRLHWPQEQRHFLSTMPLSSSGRQIEPGLRAEIGYKGSEGELHLPRIPLLADTTPLLAACHTYETLFLETSYARLL